MRANEHRVRRTGRKLVRHGRDRRAVVGLVLLATDHDDRDIPLIRTTGPLSDYFAPWRRGRCGVARGGAEALTWLGDRSAG